jgi:hydroxypyruvate reductase
VENLLISLFNDAVAAVHPRAVLPGVLAGAGLSGPVTVVGAGKAVAAMAEVAEQMLDVTSGVVVTTRGLAAGCACQKIKVLEASHPIPDASGTAAAVQILDTVRAVGKYGTIVCLLSGGGSALMSLPVAGVSLRDIADVIRQMIAAGASIQDINCVRRHLSAVKGGRLAAAAGRARLLTFAISDVVGDDPAVIASGPTVGDSTSLVDAREALNRSRVVVPRAVAVALTDPANETPFPRDPCFHNSTFTLVATGDDALAAAQQAAGRAGFDVINLGASVVGNSRDAAIAHAKLVRELRHAGRRCLILSGGETTSRTGLVAGIGGSNTEFLLALAIELNDMSDVWALAADTDGIDGTGDQAGAWFDPGMMARAARGDLSGIASGLAADAAVDPRHYLESSNSATFFKQMNSLLVTGPTGTNVNDFRAILVG